MSDTPKKKLCWNCEGRVSLEEENCPYCAVYLGPSPENGGNSGMITPPYRIVESDEEEVPKAPYAVDRRKKEHSEPEVDLEHTQKSLLSLVFPIIAFASGALLSLFGIILFFFSEEGVLTLSWDGTYWYIHLIIALPLLAFGWRALNSLDEESIDNAS